MTPIETGVIKFKEKNVLKKGNKNKIINTKHTDLLNNNMKLLKLKNNKLEKIKKYLYFMIKRFFDILFSLIGIIFIIPVGIITKIVYIANGDQKKIFYKQERVGKNGKKIYIYKFRSMVHNADEILSKLLEIPEYNEEWQKKQKFEKDPRITKFGNILRKTSLDELPQFINVLKGDMALIGPRPLVVGELDLHNGNHEIYESIRPGISGWWACNGRSATSYEKRLELEYYYCINCGLLLDLKCIFLTIKAIIIKDGAK